MKTRNIKTLLQIMLDNKQYFYSGLCALAFDLFNKDIISEDEYNLIDDFIYDHMPRNASDGYYWTKGEWSPRRRWMKYWIKRLSKK